MRAPSKAVTIGPMLDMNLSQIENQNMTITDQQPEDLGNSSIDNENYPMFY